MADQQRHFEENKEPSKRSEDHPNSMFVQNPLKENSLHSILLSVAFYLSIIYLVLFVFSFNIFRVVDVSNTKLLRCCYWDHFTWTRDEEGE